MFKFLFNHGLTALLGAGAVAYAYLNCATYFVA